MITYIEKLLPDFNETYKAIAHEIINQNVNILKLSIDEFAGKIGINKAVVVRFCKTIGLKGYKDLKMSLINFDYETTKINFESNIHYNVETVIQSEFRNLDILKNIIEHKEIESVVNIIANVRHIKLFGIGASYIVALDFAQKLERIGISCSLFSDSDLQVVSSINAREDDIAFCISYSADNSNIKKIIHNCHQNKAIIILMTSNYTSELIKKSNVLLKIPKSEANFRIGAGISRIHQLIMIDILFVCLIEKIGIDADKNLHRSFDALGI